MNTALNRTVVALLTNKSGGNLNYGDVVVLDNTNANGFTTTTTAGLSTRGLGVIIEPNGIANNATGLVALGGWIPKVNLNTAATVGQFLKSHTVAGQATPHSSPQVEGDFAIALDASATPSALLFGSPNGPTAGGSGTVTHTAGALTASAVMVGNGSDDAKVLASLGTTTTVLHGNAAGLPTFGAVALSTDVSGDLPFANLTQIAGLSVLGVAGSATADVDAITAGTDGHVLTRVSSSSLAFAAPATWDSATQGSSADTSMSADTMTDITGASLTLGAGTWQLSAQVCISATVAAYSIIEIAKSDNTVIATAAGGTVNGYQTLTIAPWTIVVSGSTTYKLRVQTGTASAIARKLDNGSFGQATFITATRVK